MSSILAPAGVLKNTATNRFHPIVFRSEPAPSSSPEDDSQRYKSRGHHTKGFDTLDEATACIDEAEGWHNTGLQWEWGGKDIPAITCWFSISSLVKQEGCHVDNN